MNIKTLRCPNCGAAYDPINRNCDYCGSYVLISDKDEEDFTSENFTPALTGNGNESKGVYINDILLQPGEIPIREGFGSIYRNIWLPNYSGRLLVTNKRVIRIGYINMSKTISQLDILLPDIESVVAKKTFAPYSRIKISTKDGEKYTFVVYGPQKWVKSINNAIQGI